MTRPSRSTVRAGAAAGAVAVAALLALALATPAFAHVEASGETTPAGITTVTFSFTHGCTGSPTTSLKVKLPDGTTEVTAESPTGWTSTIGDGQLSWTGGPIADNAPGSFTATMRVVGTKGDTVYLPTVQGCEQGENAWIELTPDAEADNAAPRIVLAETVPPASSSSTATPTSAVGSPVTASDAAARDAQIVHDSENSPIGAVVVVIVVAVIVAGAVILYLRNRRPSAP